MKNWREWPGWVQWGAVFTAIAGALTIVTSEAVEPYIPVTHEYLREELEKTAKERMETIRLAQDETHDKIDAQTQEYRTDQAKLQDRLETIDESFKQLDEGQLEQKILVLDISLQILRGEYTQLELKEKENPRDLFILTRKNEVAAFIRRTENLRADLQCELDSKRGTVRECS